MSASFPDRAAAGERLGLALERYRHMAGLLVLALPRGGVPVGAEVAKALSAPLDVLVVRKLGAPGHSELAVGAIASALGVDLMEAAYAIHTTSNHNIRGRVNSHHQLPHMESIIRRFSCDTATTRSQSARRKRGWPGR